MLLVKYKLRQAIASAYAQMLYAPRRLVSKYSLGSWPGSLCTAARLITQLGARDVKSTGMCCRTSVLETVMPAWPAKRDPLTSARWTLEKRPDEIRNRAR